MSDDIRFETEGAIGLVTLDRPRALNALTLEMCHRFDDRLVEWAGDPAIGAILVRAAEGSRAFCAGGDIRKVWEAARSGYSLSADFFWDEYILDWRIYHFPKPYVALIDGITMGGGVGISALGAFRVASERTMLAMPETGIGFFADVGATYVLPRLRGELGLYMALTGARLNGADCLYAGLATHYVPGARLAELRAALAQAELGAGEATLAHVRAILDRFAERPEAPIAQHRQVIDACFQAASMEEIMLALAREGGAFAEATRATLEQKSPTSLKVTLAQLRGHGGLSLDSALSLEFRISQAFMTTADFFEGVRAVLVDKDQQPRWRPATLGEVTAGDVARYFGPAAAGELGFDPPRRRG
jgi:enoyl-CoA hydratase